MDTSDSETYTGSDTDTESLSGLVNQVATDFADRVPTVAELEEQGLVIAAGGVVKTIQHGKLLHLGKVLDKDDPWPNYNEASTIQDGDVIHRAVAFREVTGIVFRCYTPSTEMIDLKARCKELGRKAALTRWSDMKPSDNATTADCDVFGPCALMSTATAKHLKSRPTPKSRKRKVEITDASAVVPDTTQPSARKPKRPKKTTEAQAKEQPKQPQKEQSPEPTGSPPPPVPPVIDALEAPTDVHPDQQAEPETQPLKADTADPETTAGDHDRELMLTIKFPLGTTLDETTVEKIRAICAL
jgi:hypothetical protein